MVFVCLCLDVFVRVSIVCKKRTLDTHSVDFPAFCRDSNGIATRQICCKQDPFLEKLGKPDDDEENQKHPSIFGDDELDTSALWGDPHNKPKNTKVWGDPHVNVKGKQAIKIQPTKQQPATKQQPIKIGKPAATNKPAAPSNNGQKPIKIGKTMFVDDSNNAESQAQGQAEAEEQLPPAKQKPKKVYVNQTKQPLQKHKNTPNVWGDPHVKNKPNAWGDPHVKQNAGHSSSSKQPANHGNQGNQGVKQSPGNQGGSGISKGSANGQQQQQGGSGQKPSPGGNGMPTVGGNGQNGFPMVSKRRPLNPDEEMKED